MARDMSEMADTILGQVMLRHIDEGFVSDGDYWLTIPNFEPHLFVDDGVAFIEWAIDAGLAARERIN